MLIVLNLSMSISGHILPIKRTLRSIAAAWALLALPSAGAQAPELSLGPETTLSARSTDNRHPALSTSPDGRFEVAVWDGIADGARRIFLREKVDGVWLPERIVDAEPLAENRSPVAAVDSAGNIHVAWLGMVGSRLRVYYASATAGRLVNWGPIDGGEGEDDNCAAPVLRLDADGQPLLAWEAGRGTRVGIRTARLENGRLVTENITPGAQSHNWFPEIFFTPDPLLVWYADQIPEFALRASAFNPETRNWEPAAMPARDEIPENSLPQLVRRPSGAFAACWIEDLSEAGSPRTDYVLISEQGDESQSSPRPIEFETQGAKESLARVMSGDKLALAWCSKSLSEGWHIKFSAGTFPPFPAALRITDSEAHGYYDHPSIAPLPDGAAIVWHSSESFGGDGRILYRAVRF